MKTLGISFCKLLWAITPSFTVRKIYLSIFMKLVRGRKTTRTVEGMTFELDLSEMIDVCLYLEKFERDIAEIIEERCQPGHCVLDIGANIGAHSLRFAKQVGPTGAVYAFEPTIYAFDKLVRNIALNSAGPIHAVRMALSNQNESNKSISFRSSWQTDGSIVSGTCRVDFVRLDEWCQKNGIGRVDMIKIDVDGNEFPVFDGARKLISTCLPIIIMEVGALHFSDPRGNFLSILAEYGYRFFDTKTRREYCTTDEIKGVLPNEDPKMTVSINVLGIPAAVKSAQCDQDGGGYLS